ncbi:MAG: hypothetical protein BMS9Abin06_0460 [Gammaproteobacteria bacterium]|nr:MAG: hypothetical protein BMS9Abin06_0460 [Gammaproteobacteria bacterium]
MERYNPSQAPDPDEWQALDEFDRIELIQAFHAEADEEIPEGPEKIHAVIHVVVENQLAMGVEPIPATIAKLTRQGLDRHEAIHAVGAVLSENIFELLQSNEASWDSKRYRKRLEKLTAKRWRKGQW